MAQYYLDIETTGLEPHNSKIVTIQYVPLERKTGHPLSDITILKEWEIGEGEMMERFVKETPINDEYRFGFLPIGYNLSFEQKFLLAKSLKYGTGKVDIFDHPYIDLHQIGIMMNGGEFKGSGLDKLTGKPQNGSSIPEWYEKREYGNIENYILTETREFIKWFEWLLVQLPRLREEWQQILTAQV